MSHSTLEETIASHETPGSKFYPPFLVTPELGLTSYTAADLLFQQSTLLKAAEDALHRLLHVRVEMHGVEQLDVGPGLVEHQHLQALRLHQLLAAQQLAARRGRLLQRMQLFPPALLGALPMPLAERARTFLKSIFN